MISSSENGEDMPDNAMAQGNKRAETPEGRWSTPTGIAIISTAITIVLAFGVIIVGANVDPADDANYIVTALAAIIASLNVLFTLWLLRTAQRQLQIMRDQAIEQREDARVQITQLKESHDAERNEATAQLESLREQLELAQESHLAERQEAARSLEVSEVALDESLRARLDQVAPRVSLAVVGTEFILHERRNNGSIADHKIGKDQDLSSFDGVAKYSLEVVFYFRLKNWGSEPVTISTSSPWEDHKNGLLSPGEMWPLRHSFTILSHNLRDVARAGIKRNDQESEWAFPVVVSDLGGQVTDYHVWRIHPMPLREELGKIVQNPDWVRSYLQFAIRERRYNSLDRRDLAAGKTLDGPRL